MQNLAPTHTNPSLEGAQVCSYVMSCEDTQGLLIGEQQ